MQTARRRRSSNLWPTFETDRAEHAALSLSSVKSPSSLSARFCTVSVRRLPLLTPATLNFRNCMTRSNFSQDWSTWMHRQTSDERWWSNYWVQITFGNTDALLHLEYKMNSMPENLLDGMLRQWVFILLLQQCIVELIQGLLNSQVSWCLTTATRRWFNHAYSSWRGHYTQYLLKTRYQQCFQSFACKKQWQPKCWGYWTGKKTCGKIMKCIANRQSSASPTICARSCSLCRNELGMSVCEHVIYSIACIPVVKAGIMFFFTSEHRPPKATAPCPRDYCR